MCHHVCFLMTLHCFFPFPVGRNIISPVTLTQRGIWYMMQAFRQKNMGSSYPIFPSLRQRRKNAILRFPPPFFADSYPVPSRMQDAAAFSFARLIVTGKIILKQKQCISDQPYISRQDWQLLIRYRGRGTTHLSIIAPRVNFSAKTMVKGSGSFLLKS